VERHGRFSPHEGRWLWWSGLAVKTPGHGTARSWILSVAYLGLLSFRHVRSPSASPPRHLALENIGPLLHGCVDSRTLEKRLLTKSLSVLIVTDETRAGERGVSPFEKQKMLSGECAYDLNTFRALFSGGLVSLWFQGRAFFSPRAFYLRRSRSAFQAWRDLHEFRHEPL